MEDACRSASNKSCRVCATSDAVSRSCACCRWLCCQLSLLVKRRPHAFPLLMTHTFVAPAADVDIACTLVLLSASSHPYITPCHHHAESHLTTTTLTPSHIHTSVHVTLPPFFANTTTGCCSAEQDVLQVCCDWLFQVPRCQQPGAAAAVAVLLELQR